MIVLASQLVFWAQSAARDHIRAEEDFLKEIYSWKDQFNRDKTERTEWENGVLSGEVMEWNIVERAITTEIDTRTNKKERANSAGLCLWREPQHPQHVKVSPRRRPQRHELLSNGLPEEPDHTCSNSHRIDELAITQKSGMGGLDGHVTMFDVCLKS